MAREWLELRKAALTEAGKVPAPDGSRITLLNQAELLPQLLARVRWADRLRGRRVVAFVDSNSARFGLISGYSRIVSSATVVSSCWLLDAFRQTSCWYERVPSQSNPTDGPTRGNLKEMVSLGAERVPVLWPPWFTPRDLTGTLRHLIKFEAREGQ